MFNIEQFDIKLNTDLIGRNFIYTDEIDSTNAGLLDKENKININGTVLLAEKQTKGRGRKDRVWYSKKDQNLTFSILISGEKYIKKNLNYINFGTSLAIAMSIENLYQLKTDLKWPNDVLINGKKVCGILIESVSEGSSIKKLVIGIGLNVNQTAFEGSFAIEPTSIKLESNQNIERERLLAEILNIFEEQYNRINDEPEKVLNDWRQRCRMIGERVSIIEGENSKYGIFDDIDENGYLLLRVKDKIERIHFGDVSLR
ncbi:MAG: biotin--[acetyl-CoA-carboxylase] ligase [Syntrophothermus sp.]